MVLTSACLLLGSPPPVSRMLPPCSTRIKTWILEDCRHGWEELSWAPTQHNQKKGQDNEDEAQISDLFIIIKLLCWLAGLGTTHVGGHLRGGDADISQNNNTTNNKQCSIVFQVQLRRTEAVCTSAFPNSWAGDPNLVRYKTAYITSVINIIFVSEQYFIFSTLDAGQGARLVELILS